MQKPAQAQACGPLPEIPSVPRRVKSSLHVPAPKLAYCPITYILALAHAERAFKDERLTSDYILRLREPPMEASFPVSVLPRFCQARFSHDPIWRPRRLSRRHL